MESKYMYFRLHRGTPIHLFSASIFTNHSRSMSSMSLLLLSHRPPHFILASIAMWILLKWIYWRARLWYLCGTLSFSSISTMEIPQSWSHLCEAMMTACTVMLQHLVFKMNLAHCLKYQMRLCKTSLWVICLTTSGNYTEFFLCTGQRFS